MAGKGRKVWTRETVSSADMQDYLMDQAVQRFATQAQRAAQLPAPTEGMVSYRDEAKAFEVHDGTVFRGFDVGPWRPWVPVLQGGSGFAEGVKTNWFGSYMQHGRTVTALFTLGLGSGFAQGASGPFSLSLPVAAAVPTGALGVLGGPVIGSAWLWAASTVAALARLRTNGRVEFLHHGSAGGAVVGVAAPWAWAAPNIINGSVTYEAA